MENETKIKYLETKRIINQVNIHLVHVTAIGLHIFLTPTLLKPYRCPTRARFRFCFVVIAVPNP